jgi:hypothetical protein
MSDPDQVHHRQHLVNRVAIVRIQHCKCYLGILQEQALPSTTPTTQCRPRWQLIAATRVCSCRLAMYLERDGQQRHYQQVLVEVNQPIAIDVEVFHEEVALHEPEQEQDCVHASARRTVIITLAATSLVQQSEAYCKMQAACERMIGAPLASLPMWRWECPWWAPPAASRCGLCGPCPAGTLI